MHYSIAAIEPSAFKHGISEERIQYVVAHPVIDVRTDGFVLLLGYDRNLIPLEVGGIVVDGNARLTWLRIIHAERARPEYRRQLERLLG